MTGNEFLAFSKKERNGILALMLILIAVIFLPGLFKGDDQPLTNAEKEKIEALTSSDKNSELTANESNQQERGTNYADRHDRDYVRKKNFYNNQYSKKYDSNKPVEVQSRRFEKKAREPVEINSADTTVLVALPFIGSKLASRIVLFRDKLGGFADVDQVGEVYGLRDSVFAIIKPFLICDKSKVRKIPINTAAKEDMQQHPYIRWQIANALTNFRTQHGPFKSISDLEQIGNIDSVILRKLEPYITFD